MGDTKSKKGAEGRRYARSPVEGFSLTVYRKTAAAAHAVRKNIGEALLDISAGGCRLRVSEPVTEGTALSIEIKELATGEIFHARAEVKRPGTETACGKP